MDELNSVTQERDDLKKLYDGLRKKRCVLLFPVLVYSESMSITVTVISIISCI